MKRNRVNIQKHAMHFGTYMGIFWIAKFAFFPLGLKNPLLLFVFVALTIAVPFLAHRYAKNFRDNICEGNITFSQSWVFLVFMFLFASMLTAVAHYIYFQFIDYGYIVSAYSDIINNLPENLADATNYKEQFNELLELTSNMTPIEITMQLLSSNILNCSILSLVISFFIKKKNINSAS